MARIVVDPLTRIEGHMRLEMEVSGKKVTKALASGTAWRGIELIVKDRDPRDVWAYVERICGVCTGSHALASVRAVEDAVGIKIPKNANYIRNIMDATLAVHDHIVHFYQLHALDFVSPIEALKADPAATSKLQNDVLASFKVPFKGPFKYNFSAYPKIFPTASTEYFQGIKDKIQDLVSAGQLGIFAANWWDHPDYKILPPEVHLMAIAHYLQVLDHQRDIVIPHVIFGGKNPHPHFVVGGVTTGIDMNEMNSPINADRLSVVDTSIYKTLDLVNYFYLPDLLAIGKIYTQKGVALDGGGLSKKRVLSFGCYPDEPFASTSNGTGEWFSQLLVSNQGVVEDFHKGAENAKFYDIDAKDLRDKDVITETTTQSWYKDTGKLHPWDGETVPNYTGPKIGTKSEWVELNEDGKYTWVKTPLWKGKVCEVGPLARYIITYTKMKQNLIKNPTWADKMMVDQVDFVSNLLRAKPEVWLPSTLGRVVARALDAQLSANVSKYYHDKLVTNIGNGDTDTANVVKWDPSSWPDGEIRGVGLYEAPRGALSHWITIKDGKTKNYQAVVPTTWNACAYTQEAGHGAFEESMLDTSVQIAQKPLEIVRAVRSFDPCIACSTHLYDPEGKEVSVAHTDPYIRR